MRMKGSAEEEIAERARELLPLCREMGATLIIDDSVGAVVKSGADGVHLGKDDMPPREARKILGPGKIIGCTANTADDVLRLWREGADYIGCGPFRFTTTKKNLSPIIGLEGYERIMKTIRSAGCPLPIIAIGGITRSDIAPVMKTGVDGIAISSAIEFAEDPIGETGSILRSLRERNRS